MSEMIYFNKSVYWSDIRIGEYCIVLCSVDKYPSGIKTIERIIMLSVHYHLSCIKLTGVVLMRDALL